MRTFRNLEEAIGGFAHPTIRANDWGYLWHDFFEAASIEEVLDAIGLIYAYINQGGAKKNETKNWKAYIERVFEEQAMGYRLDAKGAVRRLVDVEFQRNRFATVTGLGRARYKSALEFYERATAAIEAKPADTLTMVRGVFDANEEVFKLMCNLPGGRLVAGNARQGLPVHLNSNQPQQTAEKEVANAFAAWVTACQQYRRAPGIETGAASATTPSEGLALALFSQGSAFLRLLIAQDQEAQAAAP